MARGRPLPAYFSISSFFVLAVVASANVDARLPVLYCGSAPNGLAVEAVSAKSEADACPIASKVADASVSMIEADTRLPFTLVIDGARWRCRERRGDPNPFIECVLGKGRRETVRLTS